MKHIIQRFVSRFLSIALAVLLLLQILPMPAVETRAAENTRIIPGDLDLTAPSDAYTCSSKEKWVPMFPTGAPQEGTWPAWDDTHYADLAGAGYQDVGALHLKSSPGKNTAVAINAGMTAGRTYTLGLWAKGTSDSGKVLALYANGDPVVIGEASSLTSDWSYYEISFTASGSQLNLLAPDWGNTDIYIDNITLKYYFIDLLSDCGDFYEEIAHTTAYVPDTVNTGKVCDAYNCRYSDCWVPMFPTGAPQAGTWPAWDDTHYAEIVDEGYQDVGALHMKSVAGKNTAVAINAGMVPGEPYTLGVWVKGTSNAGRVLALYANSDSVIIQNASDLSSDWRYYEITFTATMSQLNILSVDWGYTELFLDNMTLKNSSGVNLLEGVGNFCKEYSTALQDANLNFEYSSVDTPLNWTHRGILADSTMSMYTKNAYSGSQALRIRRQNGQLDYSFVFSQVYIPVSYGDKLEFVANIASRNSISGTFSMYIQCFGEDTAADHVDFAYGQERITHAGEEWSQWDRYSLQYTVPEGVQYVKLAMRIGGAQADVLIDDITYYNYTESYNTVYTEDFSAPSATTGLPGGWTGTATAKKGKLILNSGSSAETRLYSLQTDCRYTLKADVQTSSTVNGKLVLEAVNWNGSTGGQVATLNLNTGGVVQSVKSSFTAVSGVYYRLTVQSDSGTIYLDGITLQKTAEASQNGDNTTQTVGQKWTIDGQRTTSSVEVIGGKTYLLVNGQPQVPMWYARPENPILYEQHTVTEFAKAGVDTVVSYIFLNNYYGDIWTEEGFVSDGVDDMMAATLAGNSNAKIIVTLDFNAPQWWCEQNPDELAALANSTPEKTNASFASEKWKQESGAIMKEAIDYLMKQPYADQIIGFKVTGGYTLEWNWWASSGVGDDVGDFSRCGIMAFREWLKEKYGTDIALQSAYGDSRITLQNAMPPSAAMRSDDYLDTVITVQDHTQMMDYELYMAKMKADTIEYFAKLAKDAVDDRLIVGTYAGYFYPGGGYEFSSAVANVYFQQLLQSEYLDFIKSPWMYGMREIGDSAQYMGPVDSLDLYGKLWIVEDDTRMNLQEMYGKQDDNAAVGQTRDYEQSVAQIKRNVSYVLSKGMGISFYDLMWNFYDDAQYYGAISELYEEMKYSLCLPMDSTAEIAVFVDGESNMLIPYEEQYANSILYNSVFRSQLEELGHAGASYDMYLLDDLKDGLVPEHKINIFLATTMMTEAERVAIETQLQKNGNILVWIFTDGISDGNSTDISLMEDLIGMDLGIISTERKKNATLHISDHTHWLTTGMTAGQYYGVETYDMMSPVIAVQDSTATALGYHTDLSGQVALAVKDMGSWTSIYSAVPNLPQILFRNMLKKVGGHIYTDSGSDVIYANESYVALHSLFAGERQICLPEECTVYDVFAQKIVASDNDTFTVSLNGKDTKLFRLMQASEELLTIDSSAMTGAYQAPEDRWTPMYPTGTPGSTWPAWSKATNYGEVVPEGYLDSGALHLKSDSGKNTGVALQVGMTPGESYTLGLWVKGTSNAGRVLALYANGDPAIITTHDELTADWSYYEISFTATIGQINLMAVDWGVTDLYIDNITLKNAEGRDLLAGYGDFVRTDLSNDHNWLDAACTSAKTCVACGITEGEALGHHYGEWVVVTPATLASAGLKEKTCTLCQDTVSEQISCLAGDVEGWSLTLGGDLSVNFKISVHETLRETAQIRMTVADRTDDYAVKDLAVNTEDGCYYVSVRVAAAQMGDSITVQIVNGADATVTKTYSVLDYATAVLSDSSMLRYHSLVKEMLHYGAAAQVYFDYNTDRPVDAGIAEESAVQIPEAAEQEQTIIGTTQGLSFYGASLVFENKIAIRYYFSVSDDSAAHSFTMDGESCQAVKKGDYYYIEAEGINPQDLDEQITVVADGTFSVTYSPMNYLVRMGVKGSANLQNLLQAMYRYHLAAEAFCSQ